jgi:hypothetical protein
VLADYKAHKAMERAQTEADALYRKQVLTRMATGCLRESVAVEEGEEGEAQTAPRTKQVPTARTV